MFSSCNFDSNNQLIKKIENYCAYQERCHFEVKQKLSSLGVFGNKAEELIGVLIERGFINETRFAKAFVRGKFRIKKWGKYRLIRELKTRKISEWNIKNALKEISEIEYLDCCKALVKRFWLSNKDNDLQIRKKKIWNALRYRGWENELIIDNILELENQRE